MFFFLFFFNDTATTEIYTLSLHDALPIYQSAAFSSGKVRPNHETNINIIARRTGKDVNNVNVGRSEERFSRNAETDLVCRLLLEKKKKIELIVNIPDRSSDLVVEFLYHDI